MMMMSAPSSSFHDYLAMDSCLPKMEAMTPIMQTNEEYLGETFDNSDINSNNNRNNRNTVIKRPMNAFLLWARGERKRVSSDGYGVSQTSLSKLLGETWRHMSVEEKQPFLDMAETLKRQHHIDHPDYKFKPKQRSTNGNKTTSTTVKKNNLFTPQRQLSTIIPSPPHCTSSLSQSSPMSNATPHPIQSNVLAMCQAMIPSSPLENNNDWFSQLTGQPQSVIVAPIPRNQTSPISSRRAVRIQIINKHDDIVLPPPTLLPMTPPPPSSSHIMEDSTPTLVDYLANNCNIFNIPTNNNPQVLAPVMDDANEYETLHDSSVNHLTDLDQHYDSSGWIDTPLSSFGTNSTDIVPSSPYSSYDFLCL
ncbi:unnamed protein product [Adineta steineri]|uniref:HMG box domain-containing protein n=1 Tax=Adineta steineri TaxID=433720 RepID=A0A813W411_9BILA|nr:unnamed protein product [Adineta steineri]CAF1198681.1 unnamed protein product [Adineta steineri]